VFHSVAPPKRYLEELIALLRFKEIVSADHINLYVQMTNERMRRVIKIHPEFNNLNDSDQVPHILYSYCVLVYKKYGTLFRKVYCTEIPRWDLP